MRKLIPFDPDLFGDKFDFVINTLSIYHNGRLIVRPFFDAPSVSILSDATLRDTQLS